MPIHDDHIHLRAHVDPVEEHQLVPVLDSANEKGIIPGIREHPLLPPDYRLGPRGDCDYAMIESEIDRFFGLFKENNYPVGLEIDYITGEEEEITLIFNKYVEKAEKEGLEISGIHGSVHFLPGSIKCDNWREDTCVDHVMWDLNESIFIAHLKERGAERLLHDYFGAMERLIDQNIYNTLSHMDLLRKFDRKDTSGRSIYFGDVEDLYVNLSKKVIEKISGTDMAVEINTAGVSNLIGRPYITQEILNYAVELDVPVSVGSDAHTPDRIGQYFDLAFDMLRKAGRDYAVTFAGRKPVRYDFTG
ncbi:MAG TPA: hypothetical protein PLN69_02240 [bacterium]|nr:hypothetical protein [bacterium]